MEGQAGACAPVPGLADRAARAIAAARVGRVRARCMRAKGWGAVRTLRASSPASATPGTRWRQVPRAARAAPPQLIKALEIARGNGTSMVRAARLRLRLVPVHCASAQECLACAQCAPTGRRDSQGPALSCVHPGPACCAVHPEQWMRRPRSLLGLMRLAPARLPPPDLPDHAAQGSGAPAVCVCVGGGGGAPAQAQRALLARSPACVPGGAPCACKPHLLTHTHRSPAHSTHPAPPRPAPNASALRSRACPRCSRMSTAPRPTSSRA